MPIISVKMFKGRDTQNKQKFVEAITKDAVDILGVRKESVTVLFEEYEKEDWASGGEIYSLKK